MLVCALYAQAMLKRASGAGPTKGIQGFVIEFPTAGGHNAPPRGYKYDADKKSSVGTMNERGEPVYGAKDEVDLAKFKKAVKGLPFYLAGFYGRPDKLQDVLAIGGAGIQVKIRPFLLFLLFSYTVEQTSFCVHSAASRSNVKIWSRWELPSPLARSQVFQLHTKRQC